MLTRRGLLKRAVAGLAGAAGVGGLLAKLPAAEAASELPPFRNFIGTYKAVSTEDLIRKIREMKGKTGFTPPCNASMISGFDESNTQFLIGTLNGLHWV